MEHGVIDLEPISTGPIGLGIGIGAAGVGIAAVAAGVGFGIAAVIAAINNSKK